MKVFKFGGASVSTPERIGNLPRILEKYRGEKLLIVVSAMGKTTNALEKVTEAFFRNDKEEAIGLFEKIKTDHDAIAKTLTGNQNPALKDCYTEVEWLLHDKPVRNYDYYYDQVVCTGELLSTLIVSDYLQHAGFNNKWIDVRDILRTDDNFRDANIDWGFTTEQVNTKIKPLFDQFDIIVTQGFIGSTDENESTTLGREGSDYTAAVFASMLDAESQTIWKDVKGVMNADPKQYEGATLINELNYKEVIEMAFYGAQVIHPKTIKPLQNKNIPLLVKCFLDPTLPGTVIHNKSVNHLPPIIVIKEKQAMIELISKDFSFVGEHHVSHLYGLLSGLKIKPNLTQNAAISFLCVLDDHTEKIEKLALESAELFDVQVSKGLTLLTIRHFTDDIVMKLIAGKKIVLQQRTPETVQFLMQ